MAEIIGEPKDCNPETADWQMLLRKLTLTTGGLLLVQLTNYSNALEPMIKAGSRLEINGSFYITGQDETIEHTSPPDSGKLYIYAVPGMDGCSWEYQSQAPVFEIAKGGLYLGEKRCVGAVMYDAIKDRYYDKVVARPSEHEDQLTARYPVGDFYIQYPDAPSPARKGIHGLWEDWSLRTVMYGLAAAEPASAFADDYKTHLASIWNLNTDGTVATNINGARKYPKPLDYITTTREACQNDIVDEDWETGYRIPSGPYTGLYVWEPVCLAGTFPSFHDGGRFRPPFNSGVAGDVSRNIYGSVVGSYDGSINAPTAPNGAFKIGKTSSSYFSYTGGAIAHDLYSNMNSSHVVPTGPENSPRTLSMRLWRRIA